MRQIWTIALCVTLSLTAICTEIDARHFGDADSLSATLFDDPVFKDYRGVTLGMAAADVRQKLGKPEDQSDTEDSFEPEKGETLRIIYNAEKKVRMISIMFTSNLEKAPTPKAMFGTDAATNESGGIFKRMDYTEQGFWISYAKIAGDDPMIVITVQTY